MAEVLKFSNNPVDLLIEFLHQNVHDIDSVVAVIKFKSSEPEDNSTLIHSGCSLEFMAKATKMIDYEIFNTLHQEMEDLDI